MLRYRANRGKGKGQVERSQQAKKRGKQQPTQRKTKQRVATVNISKKRRISGWVVESTKDEKSNRLETLGQSENRKYTCRDTTVNIPNQEKVDERKNRKTTGRYARPIKIRGGQQRAEKLDKKERGKSRVEMVISK